MDILIHIKIQVSYNKLIYINRKYKFLILSDGDQYLNLLSAKAGVIGGLSLVGLAATIGLKYSEIFGNVLSQSGLYWYKPNDCKEQDGACQISSEFEKVKKLPLKFYLNVGILEEKDNMIGVNKILLQYQCRCTVRGLN